MVYGCTEVREIRGLAGICPQPTAMKMILPTPHHCLKSKVHHQEELGPATGKMGVINYADKSINRATYCVTYVCLLYVSGMAVDLYPFRWTLRMDGSRIHYNHIPPATSYQLGYKVGGQTGQSTATITLNRGSQNVLNCCNSQNSGLFQSTPFLAHQRKRTINTKHQHKAPTIPKHSQKLECTN